MYKLFISTPCYGATVSMQYMISILKLTNFLRDNNIVFVIDFIGNESLITRARNISLGKFIKSDFTHMLCIDSDIEFPEQAVIDLLNFNKDVVCCTYAKKGYDWHKMMYSLITDKESKEKPYSRGLDYSHNVGEHPNKRGNNDFMRIKECSTGFMLISKDIVTKLVKKHKELEIIHDNLSGQTTYYGLFNCMVKNKRYLSEDYSFCNRVADIDGEIWLNIKHNLTHYGTYGFKSDISNRHNLCRRPM